MFMSTKFNSASRLFSVFSEIKSMPVGTSYIDTFANIFELDKTLPYYEKEALNLAFLCLYELDSLEKYVHEVLKYPKDSFQNEFLNLRQSISLVYANSGVEYCHQYITDSALQTLKLFIYNTPSEDSEKLVELIKNSISKLEKTLSQENYSEAFKVFIQEQIKTLKASLIKYSISGLAALQEAEKLIAGSIFANIRFIKDFSKTEAFISLMAILSAIDEVKNIADKAQEYIEYSNELGITNAINQAIVYIQQLPVL